jgi:hypothetical protein
MKEHYTNWHWGDWFRDTASLASSTRGIWMDMIGEMARLQTDRLHSQFEKLPYILRDTQPNIMLAAIELATQNIADVLIDGKPMNQWRSEMANAGQNELDWITNSMAKSWLTVICRRRTRELHIIKIRSEAGKKGASATWQTDGKQHGKTDSKPMTNAGNGNGSGTPNPLPGESEGGTKPAPAAKLTNWTEPEEWAKLAYTAFTATPPPTFPSPLLVHQCAGLIAAGRTKPEFQSLVDWRRTTHNSHAPNSPTTLCDPEKWEQWHSMKRKEENGDDQDHRSDRSRGTANAGTHASYKKPFGISRPQG